MTLHTDHFNSHIPYLP